TGASSDARPIALARRIDAAAVRAWPQLDRIEHDGWHMGFSHGFTGRANSVTVLSPGALPLAAKIAFAEEQYAARRLPAIFRLTSFGPRSLDEELNRRGYTVREG